MMQNEILKAVCLFLLGNILLSLLNDNSGSPHVGNMPTLKVVCLYFEDNQLLSFLNENLKAGSPYHTKAAVL